jgi:peptide/nickel transport system substrate-binding protein
MRTAFRSFAISSVAALLMAGMALGETRPRYGDTLRIETRSAAFLTPGSYGGDDSLSRLLFDTLTTVGMNGAIEPALATMWQGSEDGRRWQFWLRRNVVWHDGAPLTPEDVAQIVGAANASWRVHAVGDSVVIETDSPMPGMAAETGLTRNAMLRKAADGTVIGTGAYKIAANANGRIVLRANEDYWRARAFADAVEITMGRSLRDQALDLEVGRADITEASVEDLRRGASPRARMVVSRPIEFMAVVFSPKHGAVQNDRVREALALALDRNVIQSVLLQRQGEAGASLLPNWMTGYAFAFAAAQDLARARQLKIESGARGGIAVGYSTADPLARVIAERVVLNARDAAFNAQLVTDMAAADMVVERITLRSADPWTALSQVATEYGLQEEFKGAAWQDLFNAEHDLLAKRVMVPIVHLPRVYTAGARAPNVRVRPDGTIDLPQVWVAMPERSETRPVARTP